MNINLYFKDVKDNFNTCKVVLFIYYYYLFILNSNMFQTADNV